MKRKAISPLFKIQKEIQHKIKLLKRKRMLLKIKAVLLVFLPVLIVLISIKVLKTYLHIRLRELFHHQREHKAISQTYKNIDPPKKEHLE